MDPEENVDPLRTEDNLFDVLNDDFSEDEEDDIVLTDDKSFDEFDEEESDDDEDDEDDAASFLDDDEEDEEQDEDDQEFNEKELESLNKKLGTDFKSVEDLKKSFNTKEEQSDKEKEEAEYDTLTNKISLFDRYIGMDNETLIRNQLLSQATQDKKDINDQDVLDEIEETIEGLKDLKQLDSSAELLRSNLQNQKDKTAIAVTKIENKWTEAENAVAKKNVDDLQNALSEIYVQKEFMGVTVTKKDIQEVYEDIRTQNFFKGVNQNQEMIAQFALFVKFKDEISKATKRPTHSDRTKNAFETLIGSDQRGRRSITQAKGSASSGSADENLTGFLK